MTLMGHLPWAVRLLKPAMFLLFILFAFGMHSASAHDARPLSITLVEQSPAVYRVVVRAPPTLELQDAPVVIWPATCDIRETAPLNLALGSISMIACASALPGQLRSCASSRV